MSNQTKKQQLKILKERLGQVPEHLKNQVKENKKIKLAIRNSLKESIDSSEKGKTIPEISQETGLNTEIITWQLASMRKYGQAIETTKKKKSYYIWALVSSNK